MTRILPLILHSGHVYRFEARDGEPAFLFDAPRSTAATPWATGFVSLTGWLRPLLAELAPLAQVRTPSGALHVVPANQVCSTANLAAFRLTPATALMRRTDPPAERIA